MLQVAPMAFMATKENAAPPGAKMLQVAPMAFMATKENAAPPGAKMLQVAPMSPVSYILYPIS
eukprot:1690948-Karenia_brevis.AAC.1